MSSPFLDYKNATLTFSQKGASSVDPVTGNTTFARTPQVIEAILNPPGIGRANKAERPKGVDQSAIYLEGYAVDPQILPDSITGNQWAETAVVAGRMGKFFLEIVLVSPYGVDVETGSKLRGWFQLQV